MSTYSTIYDVIASAEAEAALCRGLLPEWVDVSGSPEVASYILTRQGGGEWPVTWRDRDYALRAKVDGAVTRMYLRRA